MNGAYLAELAERDATGSVAETYADIRRVVGLTNVNLIYRHLAATPGLLERVWPALRANVLAREPALEPEPPPGAVAIPAAALAAVGFGEDERRLAVATLDAYRRANARNLVAMLSVLERVRGTGTRPVARDPAEPEPILPLADLREVAPATRALLDEMSEPLAGAEEPRLVPSLLRHFAHDPALLALLWTAISPAAPGVAARAAGLRERAAAEAHELPFPAPELDGATRASCERFSHAMAAMLVAGELLRASLRCARGRAGASSGGGSSSRSA
jgi:hypothetical protein